jgi:DNA (cytosine-5)-methyltransferase 1
MYFGETAHTFKTKPHFDGVKHVLGDVTLEEDIVPDEYFVEREKLPEWTYLKGSKTIQRVHKTSGAIYKYSEGKMAFPDSLSNPSRTILTGEGGRSPSRFKHVIETERGHRRLTPIELERLNGFPDNWTAFGADGSRVSDSKRAFFMGNALVVGLVAKVGQAIAKDIADKL